MKRKKSESKPMKPETAVRRQLDDDEIMYMPCSPWQTELFLGSCTGIVLTKQGAYSPLICFRWLSKVDGTWIPSHTGWSSFWPYDAKEVLGAAEAWLMENAVPYIPASASGVQGVERVWRLNN
jgi:hypothetical protein